MKILAIDSSGNVAGVAIVEDQIILAHYSVNYKKTHSQTLLPMIDEIVKMAEVDLQTIDAIAIAAGPGSFTGLRIGSATAKGLGLALDIPIIEVPTVDALAFQLYGNERLICPMMDARRNQVYTGLYRFRLENGVAKFEIVTPQCAIAVEDMLGQINEMGQGVIFLGDGAAAYHSIISEKTTVDYEFAPAGFSQQNPSALATLALQYFEDGQVVSADAHKPEYLRLSQAERERLEREKA